ncbi:hypothetical protein NHX12_021869, partial [Muraenolepis orangiensis]
MPRSPPLRPNEPVMADQDEGQPPPSFGNGQPQRNQQHARPFFYVQPPSQQYVPMYQHWHVNNPYNHYGVPGGYNFGRPYIQPYPYMQYPGYVLPQPQMHPGDYRRMFEPRFHPPPPPSPWPDMARQPSQHPPPPGPLRREVTDSEVQTDPSDTIDKLMECLGKIRTNEHGAAERELDSGIGSQACGVFSPRDKKKCAEEGATRTASSSSSCSGAQPSLCMTFTDSTAAVYDGESSRRSLGDLGTPGACSPDFEELPLDSSSVREEIPDTGEPPEQRDLFALCLPGLVPDRAVTAQQSAEHLAEVVGRRLDGVARAVVTDINLMCDAEELLMKPETEAAVLQAQVPSPCHSSAQQTGYPTNLQDEVEADSNYRILRQPIDSSSLSAGALLKNSALLCGTESVHLPSSCISSPVSPLYYSYLPQQKANERMSVLSPSLDELSSRDERFSTDLDDMDLFPRRVYTSRRLADVVSRSSGHVATEKAWPTDSKRYSCACCGKGLAKAAAANRSKGCGSSTRSYRDETGDSDDDCPYTRSQPGRVTSRKQGMPRKADSVSLRHASKHPRQQGQRKEGSSAAGCEEGRDLCPEDTAGGETGEITSGDLQCITCQDALCREDRMFAPRPQGMNMSHGGTHQPAQGPHQPAQGLYGAPGPSEQHPLPPQHQKPFFYVHPSQPYAPMQNMHWHMPVSYNPYYGYPGLGYSMPAMNPYPPSAYMEQPRFVMPQSHHHLMDYRRMLNPHYYQTMAFQSRMLHYQHSSTSRDMISSEVQTEPLSMSQKSSTAATACGSGRGEARNGFPDGGRKYTERNCSGPAHPLPQALPVKASGRLVDLKKTSTSSLETAPQKSSFVIQTEEVRIECCHTAVGLEVLHSNETQGVLAHRYAAQDLARCSSLITQSPVLQEVAVSAPQEQSYSHQTCPDVLFDGTASCGSTEVKQSLHETKALIKRIGASPDSGLRVASGGEAQKTVGQRRKRDGNANVGPSANDGHFKILHMPFDLDELQSMEATQWSMEETCVPSPDWMMQNTLIDSPMGTLVTEGKAPCDGDLIDIFSEEVPLEQVVPMMEMPQSDDEPLIELGSTWDVPVVPKASPANGFASADKRSRPPSARLSEVPIRRQKTNSEFKELQAVQWLKAEKVSKNQIKVDRRSLSDHECGRWRNRNQTAFPAWRPKGERLCTRCLANRSGCLSVSPGPETPQVFKRKFPNPLQPWLRHCLLPTCEACKVHKNKGLMCRGTGVDICGPICHNNAGGETSETGSCQTVPKWWGPEDLRRAPADSKMRQVSRNQPEKCSVALYPQLRERNCPCDEHRVPEWEGLRRHPC